MNQDLEGTEFKKIIKAFKIRKSDSLVIHKVKITDSPTIRVRFIKHKANETP